MADVLIVGAGLIGSSLSWRLRQKGVSAVLADAGVFGGETSSAGAGMLSPGGEFDKPSRWIDLAVEGMAMYASFIEELAVDSGESIDFKICGCRHFVDSATAERRAEFQRSKGIRVEVSDGGLYYPGDAFVDPTDMLRALRKVCGAEIHENASIARLETSEFRAVVIAAGAWSNRIAVTYQERAVDLPEVKPVKGHLIGFQLEPGLLGPMLREGHTYVLQRSNGFTIAGSTEEDAGFDRTVDEGICEQIHRDAAQLFPALGDHDPIRKWIGFRPFSPDGPHIRQVEATNVWLAYGHFRNGILLTPLTSAKLAQEI